MSIIKLKTLKYFATKPLSEMLMVVTTAIQHFLKYAINTMNDSRKVEKISKTLFHISADRFILGPFFACEIPLNECLPIFEDKNFLRVIIINL